MTETTLADLIRLSERSLEKTSLLHEKLDALQEDVRGLKEAMGVPGIATMISNWAREPLPDAARAELSLCYGHILLCRIEIRELEAQMADLERRRLRIVSETPVPREES